MVQKISIWNFYTKETVGYFPTTGRIKGGAGRNIEPVEAVPIGDSVRVKSALIRMIERGNPEIPPSTEPTRPIPIILKYSKDRSWRAFERVARNYAIQHLSGRYSFIPGKRHPGGGWVDDAERRVECDETRFHDFIDRVVVFLQTEVGVNGA
jgi:hypothetical protein